MNDEERALRRALGIPDQYTSALILEQSAHCDWDWLVTFRQYYGDPNNGQHQPVRDTLEQALKYISGAAPDLPYTYVFCEVAYLQAFMNDPHVSQAHKDLLKHYAGTRFLFASGGITSADNLLSHPEAFIRNYLLGRQWLEKTFGATAANKAVSDQMWIPDDFGHDSQLPALLRAMGFLGAGFWRIPAQVGVYNNTCSAAAGTQDAPGTYLPEKVGLDFRWQASDGSTVQAHWLSQSYCQGNSLGGGSSIDTHDDAWKDNIGAIISQNTTAVMPTPYMFSPIDCDFCAPYDNGPSVFQQWNGQPGETTYVVQATFADYMQLVAAATANPGGGSSLTILAAHHPPNATIPPYIPNPYYSGFYASKPKLKILHYQTVRTLLLAESMQLLLRAIGSSAADEALKILDVAWNELVPSTHHDYITGTSPNGTCGQGGDVYDDEQVKLLDYALTSAQAAKELVLTTLAGNASSSTAGSVMIFNSLGFDRWVNAELAVPPPGGPYRASIVNGRYYPVQSNGSGGLIVQAFVPALGYTTVQLSTQAPNVPTHLSAAQNGNTVTLSNGWIEAVIAPTGITSLRTLQGVNCFPATPGNQLRQFLDGGNIYRFGNEIPCGTPPFRWNQGATFTATQPVTSGGGPLVVWAEVVGTLGGQQYTIRYELEDRGRALRISVTGSAPTATAIMAYFQFATAPASLTYGTTSSWDDLQPRNYFVGPMPSSVELMTFEPTHDYVAPVDVTGKLTGAIYHAATPAWGIYGDGIVGCLLRNTPGTQNAACANDIDTYTITYAVEPPDLLKSPVRGAGPTSMIQEALSLNTPAAAYAVTGSGALPPSLSIAKVSDERAIITAAKAGTVNPSQLVLRLYQPTNAPLSGVTVTLADIVASGYQSGGVLAAAAVNALEKPSAEHLRLGVGATDVTLDLPYAITTIALGT